MSIDLPPNVLAAIRLPLPVDCLWALVELFPDGEVVSADGVLVVRDRRSMGCSAAEDEIRMCADQGPLGGVCTLIAGHGGPHRGDSSGTSHLGWFDDWRTR